MKWLLLVPAYLVIGLIVRFTQNPIPYQYDRRWDMILLWPLFLR
jgi:hypothetical protein